MRPESVGVVPDPDGSGRVVTASFLGATSRVTITVGDHLVVAQVSGGELPDLTPGTAVRLELRPVPVATE